MKKILPLICFFVVAKINAQWSNDSTVNNTVCRFSATTAKTGTVACSDGNGGAFVSWIDARNNAATGSDIYIQKINVDGSLQFDTAGLIVCNAIGSPSNISIQPDGNGGAILVWQDPRNSSLNRAFAQSVSSTGNMNWAANGVQVTVDLVGAQTVPSVVVSKNKEIFVIVRDNRNTNTDLYAQKLNPTTGATSFVSDVAIVTATGTQNGQSAAADDNGNIVVVWADQRITSNNAMIYSQKINANGTLAWTVDGVNYTNGQTGNRLDARIVHAGSTNGFVITWTDTRVGSTDANIYAQKINETDGAPLWGANAVAVCSATGSQSTPQIARTSDNEIMICWIDPRNSGTTGNDIYAQKIKLLDGSAFSAGWTSDGVVVCNAATSQVFGSSVLIANNVGGAYFVWSDPRTGTGLTPNDIYSLTLNGDASLTVGWIANGNLMSSATNSQASPTIVASANNSFIGIWQDGKSGTANGEIRASRVLNTGVLPLTFISIIAAHKNNSIQVGWQTTNEVNTANFIVEKNINGNNFIAIGTQKANNSNGLNNYSFTDNTILSGKNIYRVKCIDKDGATTYSSIVVADATSTISVKVKAYPNPVEGQLQVQITNALKGNYTAKIIGVYGGIMQTIPLTIETSFYNKNILVQALAKGNYILQLEDKTGKQISTVRFSKL